MLSWIGIIVYSLNRMKSIMLLCVCMSLEELLIVKEHYT